MFLFEPRHAFRESKTLARSPITAALMNDSTPSATGRNRFGLGPGILVTAAFIGPGTVVTASRAGTQHGCELLWTVLFAVIGTILLQSMAARLGILTGTGLSEAIRENLRESRWLRPIMLLTIVAIGFGNAAYQTGNLTGAVVGVSALFGGSSLAWNLAIGTFATLVIVSGRDRLLQSVLMVLVFALSAAFLFTAATHMPSLQRVASGLLIPKITLEKLTLVLGMIGTTIVPYNLFLHASRSAATWNATPPQEAIRQSNWDTGLSISLGGLVTASILLTACVGFHDRGSNWETPEQIANGLGPVLGPLSGHAFAMGMFCAGLTSAVTAPLATSYAVCGCMGWPANPSSRPFRVIAVSVIAIGVVAVLTLNGSPAATIIIAQVANGMLLPIVAAVMLIVVRRSSPSTSRSLSPWATTISWIVVAFVTSLGLWRIYSALPF